MTSNPKVSIIVPIYNCDKYLNRAIDSLVNQTLKDIEIILVNDGSTDNSESICKEYLLKYDSVKYFYQSNSGVSAARNKGIKEAQGDYVMFLDADDYYNLDAAEKMYNSACTEKTELVIAGMYKNIFGEEQLSIVEKDSKNIKSIILKMTESFDINHVVAKLYCSNIILKNGLMFNEKLNSGEDFDFVCRYLRLIENVSCVNEPLYNYIIVNSESLSQRFKPDYFEQVGKSFCNLEELYKEKDMIREYGSVIYIINAQNVWTGLMSINAANCNLSFNEKQKFIKSSKNSYCYEIYNNQTPEGFSKIKKSILNIKNSYLLTVVISFMGKVL